MVEVDEKTSEKTRNTDYLLDKTNTHKVGKTNYIVSSFFKTNSPMTFMKILKKLIENELGA